MLVCKIVIVASLSLGNAPTQPVPHKRDKPVQENQPFKCAILPEKIRIKDRRSWRIGDSDWGRKKKKYKPKR